MTIKRKAAPRKRAVSGTADKTKPNERGGGRLPSGIAKVSLKAVRAGLGFASVERLREQLALTQADIGHYLGIPRQTLARRKQAGKLSAAESDRVVRYGKLLGRATDLFGEQAAAVTWLKTPAVALDGEAPLEQATTELGAEHVFDLITRLEHGIPT
jgi:putative toxin-antitoxin system antitoxin component (TIGR02293 family)